ncbi:hypothetical protein JQ608_38480 [Bradyrhizobium liaoningense]|uniref:VapE domain-containing protein n=1 Tax=Bradyrhizobium liaoningense TaxID=43992 RepID=UPI001BA53176|nr:VapE domain-containing protein [Bradyrhizobium liaoningense]MBR0882912.1 hypothetical protein [Bradyrhizobium liaoningense]
MMIGENIIEAARSADIVSTITGQGVELRKKGAEYTGLCPFHGERTPSFTVSPAKGFYHCFGCGAHGDAISFLMQHGGLDFPEAVQHLAGGEHKASAGKPRLAKPVPADEWTSIVPVPAEAPNPPVLARIRHHDGEWREAAAIGMWAYRNESGSLLGYVQRFDIPAFEDKEGSKEIRPLTYCRNNATGELAWRMKHFPQPRPLFGLDKLAKHPKASVVVVEGEKTAVAAQQAFIKVGATVDKLVVVSWPGGAQGVQKVDWSPLYGRKVGLWPDADQKLYKEPHAKAGELMPFAEQPGQAAMLAIYELLREHCDEPVKFFMPPVGVPDGWDLADEPPKGFDLLAHAKGAVLARDVATKPVQSGPEATPEQEASHAHVVLVPSYDEARGVVAAYEGLALIDVHIAKLKGVNPVMQTPMVVAYGDQLGRAAGLVRKLFPDAVITIFASPADAAEAQRVAAEFGADVDEPSEVESWNGWGECYLDLLFAHVDATASEDHAVQEEVEQALERAAEQVQGEIQTWVPGGVDQAPSDVVASTQASIIDVHHMDEVNPFEWPHLSPSQKPLNTIPNLRHLLTNYQITARYDVIRKEMVITHPGQRGTRDNAKSKALDTVISLCALNNLPRTDVPSFLASIADDTPYNPVTDFITSKPWDGRSRFEDLLQTVQTKPGFDRALLALLVRRWLISAVAAAAKPSGFWSKGVLVFQGDQSLGKTSWFRALLPPQMRDLVKVDASIDPANKDTIISAVSHWLVELGELDGTLRKADIARLKGFISQDVDQFRRPYARAEEKFPRRTVFFASVNPEQFLADDTGNVRWWTIPVVGINHGHDIDMQQLWAEAYTWYEAGERWWLDADEERRLGVSNVEHEQRDPIDELIAAKYDFADPMRRRLTATEVLLELGYQSPGKKLLNEASNAMRKQFGDWSKSNGRKVFQVPMLRRVHHWTGP